MSHVRPSCARKVKLSAKIRWTAANAVQLCPSAHSLPQTSPETRDLCPATPRGPTICSRTEVRFQPSCQLSNIPLSCSVISLRLSVQRQSFRERRRLAPADRVLWRNQMCQVSLQRRKAEVSSHEVPAFNVHQEDIFLI